MFFTKWYPTQLQAAKIITITTPDQKLSIRIDYSKGCIIKQVNLKNKNTISSFGLYTPVSLQEVEPSHLLIKQAILK